jgi:cytochrome b involved in lipid metabolism
MINQVHPEENQGTENDEAPEDSSMVKIAENQVMTRSQVAAIKLKTLIIYKNEVFDVSNFADAHPGGPQYLLVYAGKDCSVEFD